MNTLAPSFLILFCLQYVLKSFEEICSFVLIVFGTLLAVWTVVSSAYMSTYASFMKRGKSFTNRRKSTGPKTDPCGTPDLTDSIDDFTVFSMMHCFLSFKYDFIQQRDWSLNL